MRRRFAIEYDSLYERAVFGSNPKSFVLKFFEWINRDIATSEELKSDGSDSDELIAAKLNDIGANQPIVAADVHSLEVDGKLKLVPANKVDLVYEINQAKNSWVFMVEIINNGHESFQLQLIAFQLMRAIR